MNMRAESWRGPRLLRSRYARLAAGLLSLAAFAAAFALRDRLQRHHGPDPAAAEAIEREADTLMFEQGQPAEAAKRYIAAIAREPSFERWHKLGMALLASGRRHAAAVTLEHALGLAPPVLDRQRYRDGIDALRRGEIELGRAALDSAYWASRPEAFDTLR